MRSENPHGPRRATFPSFPARRPRRRQAVWQGCGPGAFWPEHRSEEHTPELQSQSNLVCRLLLEKKKSSFGYPRPSARGNFEVSAEVYTSPMRSTKIVATIGPASREPDVLEAMVRAGMDVARLNFAHGDPEEHAETVARVRRAAAAADREVAVLQDIPGPKLRLGPVAGDLIQLETESRVVLTPKQVEGDATRLPVAWPGFAELVAEDDIVYLADGAIRLRVCEVRDGDVEVEVEVGGAVASRQGLNLPNVTMSLPAVSEADLAMIDAGVEMGVDLMALSFIRRADDLQPVRERLAAHRSDIPVIAQIEKTQAAANAHDAGEAADAIMIPRGDLESQLPI